VGGSGAGTRAAGINLFNYFSFGQRDRLISPPLNMWLLGDYYFSFKHSYSQTNLQYSDSLIVKISTDCGNTWFRILTVAEDGTGNLATREPVNASFFPAMPDDWCGVNSLSSCYTLDISEFSGNSNVKIMFESVRITGNNLFIDDIKMVASVGIENQTVKGKSLFSIFPNPGKGLFTLSIENPDENCNLEIYNAQGQLIRQISANASKSELLIDLSNQSKGIYFVRITGKSVSEMKKLILE
jgi:hypothetical protein